MGQLSLGKTRRGGGSVLQLRRPAAQRDVPNLHLCMLEHHTTQRGMGTFRALPGAGEYTLVLLLQRTAAQSTAALLARSTEAKNLA